MKNIPVMDMLVDKPEQLDPNQIVSIKFSDLNTLHTTMRQLRHELVKLKAGYNAEMEQFNTGYEAGEKGGLDPFNDQPHYEPDYDVWRNGYYAGSYERLNRELAELRERTRWISVSERLPHTDGYYLAYGAKLSKEPNIVYFYANSGDSLGCTHWMPLPLEPDHDNE